MAAPKLSDDSLKILICPETKQSVRLLGSEELARVNDSIRRGQLRNRGGEVVDVPLDGALVREDGRVAYPIRTDIPVIVVEESFELSPL